MIRRIISIDESKCNGCGLCARACHESAIGIVDGKARLLRDDYCDGLGDCLPSCPTNAISFVEREAAPYDEEAVKKNQSLKKAEKLACGCAGTQSRSINRDTQCSGVSSSPMYSQLRQWPVQIKLAPINAPYFKNADLLVAADCTAYAYGDFHNEFIKDKITLIGCPKLDDTDYSEKLTQIISNNDIKSITVTRMEVPCCGGIEFAVKTAVHNSGRDVIVNIITISTDGRIL